MRMKYYKGVDLLDIQFSPSRPEETRDLGPYAWGEFDKDDRLVGITFQHASDYIDLAGLPQELVEQVEGESVSIEEIQARTKKAS